MKTPFIRGPPLNPPAHARMGPGPLWPQPCVGVAASLLHAIEPVKPRLSKIETWIRVGANQDTCKTLTSLR